MDSVDFIVISFGFMTKWMTNSNDCQKTSVSDFSFKENIMLNDTIEVRAKPWMLEGLEELWKIEKKRKFSY